MVGYLFWACGVIRTSSTRGLELQNGCAALAAGAMLLLPFDSFSVSPSYHLFTIWAPEPIWGLSLLGIGVAQIAACLHDAIVLRRIGAAVLGVLFLILGLGILWANPASVVAPIVVVLAAGQAGAFWQARRVP